MTIRRTQRPVTKQEESESRQFMFRSLHVETLGITGRQSELIELALTYRFKGLDLDIETFARQVESRGQEYATRCLESAKNCPAGLQVGVWQLPLSWDADETRIKEQMTRIPTLASVAKTIEASRCVTTLPAGSDALALNENFDATASRLTEIGELLTPHGIRLGVGFNAAAKARSGMAHEFVSTAEALITLLQSVRSENVGLYLDTWNWHLGGGTFEQLEKYGLDKLVAISVADVPADSTAESIDLNQRLLPDPSGVIPHATWLDRLHELEFDGPVTPEPHVSQYKGVTRDKIVQKAADALRSVWPGADLLEEAAAEAAEAAAAEGENAEKPAADKAGDDAKPAEAEKTAEAEKPAATT